MPKGIKFKNDFFKKSRGGYSRLLEIACVKCNQKIALYQKDGPGILKRMYVDRMFNLNGGEYGVGDSAKDLFCNSCQEHLGTLINYEKENRLAYRLFVGSVSKRIVKAV